MVIWSTGMPLFALLFFVGFTIFVFSCFLKVIRGSGWDNGRELDNMYDRNGNSLSEEEWMEPWRCPRPKCRAMNPGHAKFCRMCGHEAREGEPS